MASTLRGSDAPLTQLYDVALLDLDGVVYVGPDAVAGAPQALSAARAAGMRLAFVTNNAARPPGVVADHLKQLGIPAEAEEVITSSQAAARYLADRLPAGARVLVVGTTGLIDALLEQGLTPVADANGDLHAVVQGYSPDLDWRMLAEGAVAINRGVPWVATNVDPTVPSPRGPLPGNGSLVAALRCATGVDPVVTGKPDPTMHRESVLRSHAQRPIVVGDRLDTDIEGANAVGCPSLLVLSGVTTARVLLTATRELRPTYLASDVGGLLVQHPEPAAVDGAYRCAGWEARPSGGQLRLRRIGGPGSSDARSAADDGADPLDALRALCAAAWSAEPGGGSPQWAVVADGDDAARAAAEGALQALGLG